MEIILCGNTDNQDIICGNDNSCSWDCSDHCGSYYYDDCVLGA